MTMATMALAVAMLTPGKSNPHITERLLCSPAFHTITYRHVTGVTKQKVCDEYRKTDACPKGYEIDHLIPLELGGSNDIANLWPQPRGEARVKDAQENQLHHAVCAGQVTLPDARQRMLEQWRTK